MPQFWLVATIVTLGGVVLSTLCLVVASALRDVLARRRHSPVRWVDVPGAGILPVLRRDPHGN